jgi:porphobilinogen synthase
MSQISQSLLKRPRRLRSSSAIRDLVAEHHILATDVIMPIFVIDGVGVKEAITSLPGQFRVSLDRLVNFASELNDKGVFRVILFGIVSDKDAIGSSSWQADGLIQQAIQILKANYPHWLVVADLCFCEYTDHGHCGVIDESGNLDNDATLPNLAAQVVSLAKAGADVIAPSGMLDGMVATIRHALDAHGLSHVAIMSYAVKYASSLYGPFREAAHGGLKFGDRKSYQMQLNNGAEAELEAKLDIDQGADMLIVKPAFGDIIYRLTQKFPTIPIGAYQVSGQYAMIKAAVLQGWLDEEQVVYETLLNFKRSGARFIITYYADFIINYLDKL